MPAGFGTCFNDPFERAASSERTGVSPARAAPSMEQVVRRAVIANRMILLLFSLLVLPSPPAHAQVGADIPDPSGGGGKPGRPPAPVVAPTQVASGPDYRIGPDDQVWISVLQAPELTTTTRVSQQGAIFLPLVGAVKAGGLTTMELKRAIEEQLARKYIKEPDVTVQVTDAPSHSVSIVGAVHRPGVVQVPSSTTVLDVISLAGGLAENAGDTIIVQRKGATGAAPATQELKINPLIGSRDSSLNVPIYPGDVVKVRAADVVYVIGAVKKPGAYPMQGNERLTAMRALALGEGFAPAAAQTRAVVVRMGPKGERNEIPVDLKAVMKGKAGDVPLEAHDVLFVPTDGAAVAGRTALDVFLRTFAWRPTW